MENGNDSQSAIPRREVLCELMGEVEELENTGTTTIQTAEQAGDILKKIDDLIAGTDRGERLKKVDETILDTKILSTASNILHDCVKAVNVEALTYDEEEFANKIADYFGNNLLNLIPKLKFIHKTLEPNSLYGAHDLDVLPKPKEKSKRSQRINTQTQKKEPEKIASVQKEEEGIEDTVKYLEKVLKYEYVKNNREPIKYYKYCIDISDFGQTVENMFYFTFLIRDGKASLDLNSKGEPIIAPVSKAELKRFRDGNGENSQIISSISFDEWSCYKKPGYLQIHRNDPELLNRK